MSNESNLPPLTPPRVWRDTQHNKTCHLCGHVGLKCRHVDANGNTVREWQCPGKCEGKRP